MKNAFKNNADLVFKYVLNFIQVICLSLVIGTVGGLVGGAFHKCIDAATETREVSPWLIFLMPVGSLVIVMLYKLFASKKSINTDLVISSLREDKKIPLVMIPLIFVSTVTTQFVGGSAGREGAALQLGGSIGYNAGKLLKLNPDKTHVLIMTGMASVFSALFGTPLAAAVFSIEVACVGLIDYTALLPCVTGAATARYVAYLMGIPAVHFSDISFADIDVSMIVKVSFLSVLCAVLSIVFCVSMSKGTSFIKKLISNAYLRAVVCSCILIAATLLLGTYDYNGAGMNVVERAMRGEADVFAFALKIIFTVISLAAGFKGGEIVPVFFVGSTFGCVVSSLLGLDPALGAAIGFIALFCGVVNCPLASLMLSIEVFGAEGLVLFALSCGISYMLSGYFSLYHTQRIVYSKSDAHFIDEALSKEKSK